MRFRIRIYSQWMHATSVYATTPSSLIKHLAHVCNYFRNIYTTLCGIIWSSLQELGVSRSAYSLHSHLQLSSALLGIEGTQGGRKQYSLASQLLLENK